MIFQSGRRWLPAIFLALFIMTVDPVMAELNPLISCNIQGDSSSITFRLKPFGGDLGFDGGGPAASMASVLALVGPGEPATVRVSCNGTGVSPPGLGPFYPRFTVSGATYIGDPAKDKWHGYYWILPVEPEWNEFTVKIDLVDVKGALVSSSSRQFRFFAFVLELSPAGRLNSPFTGYPEVTVQHATTDADGNVYAAIDCQVPESQGTKTKRALVRFAKDGGNLRLYDVKDDYAVPLAADNAGRLYAFCMDHIVEFNAGMDFVRPIAAFVLDFDHELTADILRDGTWNARGERRQVPFYKDFFPDRFTKGCALYGNDLYYMAEAYPVVAGGYIYFLATTSLIDGESRKLARVNIKEGPLLGPGNALYIVEELKDSERPRNALNYLTGVMKVFGLDGTLQRSIPFGTPGNSPFMKGFDGAGCLLGRHWIATADLQRCQSLTYGRIRTRYLTLGSSKSERIDVPFQKAVSAHEVIFAGHWYHGGALYVHYTDGAIIKCLSRVPGAERDPVRGAGGVRGATIPRGVKKGPLSESAKPGDARPTGAVDPGSQGDANADGEGPAIMPPENSGGDQDPGSPVTPGREAGAAAAAGVIMVIGSFLFSLGMGVSPSDILDAVDVIFTSSRQAAPAPSPFPIQELYYEGDINANGEIYSENYGFVNPAEYQRGLATGRLIDRVNAGINARPDAVARDQGRAWTDSRRTLDDLRETRKFVDLSTRLVEKFGAAAEKAWYLDFVNRHAKAGPNGYEIDPETARKMYSGLTKQLYDSGQIAQQAETDFQNSVSAEIGRKTEVVVQIRDNATRVNRVLARFDPTGTGQKIVGLQQGAYAAVDCYDKGGVAGAAESAVLAVADNYTQGYASGNYQALKGAYAEYGITDESVLARIGKANFETANNKYNILDHAGKAADNLLKGNIGAFVDSSLDAGDAGDSLRGDYGKAKDWATKPKTDVPDKVPEPQADSVPDTTPDAGKKSLGTMRRESFEQTRKSFENETKMMQELNRVSDIPDLDQRQAELIRVRNSDPSTFNVVQKQLHPGTAEVISKTNQFTADRVVERQAQILRDQGYTPEVRLTGKAGGADTDGYWTLKDDRGKVLPDSETRKLAGDALKQASADVLQPLGTDADQMGHKIMNGSPEKFAADPNELGIKSRDGKLVDGKLVFEDHEKTGDHWRATPREEMLTAPKDRVSGAVMTRKNADSLGEVMKTKTQHLDDIARHKGAVSESDRRDMARELVKTNNRTFLPMARKAGVTPTPEFRDLMQKLMLTRDGEISSDQLPPLSEIDRIVWDNVERLKDAIKE
jgi:hypothetical protein